ncbi:MAG TPA: RNA polymerase sigma factor [Acidobacteriaceae bacterium]|nr:RNA polymerase sigma factor [Acidobacteriaceae bacterium]
MPLQSAITNSSVPSISPTRDGFRDIVERHQSRVYSIAYRILGDCGAAEEVAQDVFLALYQNLDRLQSQEHLLAWLRRVTVHRATDACRRRASRVEYAADEFCEEHMSLNATASAASQGAFAPNSMTTSIEQMVASLPPAQRAVLLLRYQEDLLPTEISAVLSIPLGTVKSHLQRALKLLRSKASRQRKEVVHG